MIFLNINIIIAIIFLAIFILSSIDMVYEFKRKYPDLKVPKRSWAGHILTWVKSIIIALIPLYNILMCCVFIFNYDELKTKTIDKVYAECIAKEKQNVTHLSEAPER